MKNHIAITIKKDREGPKGIQVRDLKEELLLKSRQTQTVRSAGKRRADKVVGVQ